MEIKIKEREDAKIIAVSGDIDMYTSPELRKQLLLLVDRKIPGIIIDLTGVSYIDSSGIATFVEVFKTMASYGGRLKFFGIPARVKEIFNFAKLDKVFALYGSIDDAFNS